MEFLKQYEILTKKGITDLKVAKNIFEDFENGDEELDLDVIMFHLQQSSEKLLKSLLAYNKHHFTKTHNLKELTKEIENHNIKISIDLNSLSPLSYYAVEGRYATVHDDIEDTEKYIKIVSDLLSIVKKETKYKN